MEFSVLGALVAGFVGTAIMTTMMKMSGKMGMTDMPPMELVTGSMLTGDRDRAMQLGIGLHWIMMVTRQPAFAGTVDPDASTVQLAAPGVMGSAWGGMTPVGLLMGHVVYGLVVALVYQAFI